MTLAPIEGRAIVLGDDVNTDNLLPGPYLNLTDPQELGRHLLETYPGDAAQRVAAGDIIVAGTNFGMGSSREQAQLAIMGRGVQAVLASSFARIFLRNAINVGLPVAECPGCAGEIANGDRVRIDFAAGVVETDRQRWAIAPQPEFLGDIVELGGLVPWARRRLADRAAEERPG
jgi:3-isopropylmalate/(R)-2-methylmalate dehydratase small subunit